MVPPSRTTGACGRAGKDLVRASSGVDRAIRAGADAVGRTGRALAGGHREIGTAIRERSEAPEGPIPGLSTTVKEIRKGRSVIRGASQEGEQTAGTLSIENRRLGRSLVASREFEQRVRQSSGEFERAVSLIRAEADQKRKAGNQVGRVEGPIESLLHKKKREAAARTKWEQEYAAGKDAYARSLDSSAPELTRREEDLAGEWKKKNWSEAMDMKIAARKAEPIKHSIAVTAGSSGSYQSRRRCLWCSDLIRSGRGRGGDPATETRHVAASSDCADTDNTDNTIIAMIKASFLILGIQALGGFRRIRQRADPDRTTPSWPSALLGAPASSSGSMAPPAAWKPALAWRSALSPWPAHFPRHFLYLFARPFRKFF